MTPPYSQRAFVLGAGLGTRLRPLTQDLPKPLVPVQGRPLVTHAFDRLIALKITEVVINTHHAPGKWMEAFPTQTYQTLKLHFRHEPILLDTGGGIKNVEDFFCDGPPFLVCNGDAYWDLPLLKAWDAHHRHGNLVTMILRSSGDLLNVALDPHGRITDLRHRLGVHPGNHQFTGIQIIDPKLLKLIPAVRPESIIDIYLGLIREGGKIGGVVLDEGCWYDIGTPPEYEKLNRLLDDHLRGE